jgi:hypothetical protein
MVLAWEGAGLDVALAMARGGTLLDAAAFEAAVGAEAVGAGSVAAA